MPRLKRKCVTASKPVYDEAHSSEEEDFPVPEPRKAQPSKSSDSKKNPPKEKLETSPYFKNLKKVKKISVETEDDPNQFGDEIRLSESGSDSDFEEVPKKVMKIEIIEKVKEKEKKSLVHGTLIKPVEKMEEKKTEKVERKGRSSRKRNETKKEEKKTVEKCEIVNKDEDKKIRSVHPKKNEDEKKSGMKRREKQTTEASTSKNKIDDSKHILQPTQKQRKSAKSRKKTTIEDMPQLSNEQIAKYENADEKDIKKMLLTFENGLQEDSKDSESDWEEVEEGSGLKKAENSAVEITIDAPNLMRKKKKKKWDMMEWFRLQLNRFRRETQMDTHKVHLLCLVAHGRHINTMCSHPPLQALCLSLVPMATANLVVAKWDLQAMNKFMNWFSDVFGLRKVKSQPVTKRNLMRSIQSKKVASRKELVMIYVIMIRSLGLEARIIHSLQPVTSKATDLKAKNGEKDEIKTEKKDEKSEKKTKEKSQPIEKKKNKKSKEQKVKNSRQRRSSSKVNYGETDEEEEEEEVKTKRRRKSAKRKTTEDELFQREAEYRIPSSEKKISPVASVKSGSSDEHDWWVEVYLQSMKKWICVDCIEGRINHANEMEKKVTQPMAYVLGFDSDFAVKDLTKKYAKNWMSYTRKLRTDEEWWKASLVQFKSWKTERESLEDAEIEASFIKQPLPTSISDYKNHPLYALKRHVLKFEAIYPDTAVPIGFLKNKEPVYARECVKTLHSRQNWLKEARLVRIGEEPYKIVKARMTPSRAKLFDGKTKPMLEIFGFWQTEDYIPPPAHDGKVPRNEYGNVELFKPSMLPGGTVHLKGMPGLNRIARKLDIDCSAAMTGWTLHGGHNHPLMEGWVVCEEHKDILLAAWDEEQEIIQEREREKKEKRTLANWKLLIKGLLVRERLKHKYDTFKHLKEIPKEERKENKSKKAAMESSEGKKATDVQVSWPRNLQKDQEKNTKKKKKDSAVPFPFEVETM